MSDKKAYEAYRVRQFSGPHPALQAATESATIIRPSTLQLMKEENDGHVSMHNGSEQQWQSAERSADPLGVQLPADDYRVIVHFDVDAFYSQVEEVRNPSLRGRPLAVTQKYLVVTCNYPARQAGATKLMNIGDAKRACPGLVLVPGEDLTPYRHASRDIRAVLSRWGPTEKLGLDECWVDLTQEVNLRMSSSSSSVVPPLTAWPCPLATASVSLTSHSKHRPQDLRAMAAATPPAAAATTLPTAGAAAATATAAPPAAAAAAAVLHTGSHLQHSGLAAPDTTEDQDIAGDQDTAEYPSPATAAVSDSAEPDVAGGGMLDGGHDGEADRASSLAAPPSWQCRLYHGCCIAAEMKAAVAAETQYRCSAGVAFNKLLSKLVSGLHKPNGQTAITPAAAAAFLAPLPVRALPGVGFKSESALKAWGVVTVADVRGLSQEKLVQLLGDKTGTWLFCACRGVDATPVTASGPPKTLSVEDSFKGCSSWSGVSKVLQVLVPDLLERIAEDVAEFGPQRRPTTLSIKWRKAGQGWARNSASIPWPITHNKTLAMNPINPRMTQNPRSTQNPADQADHQAQKPSKQEPGGLEPDGSNPDHVDLITAAALRILKQQLQGSFCLTLLNIGVTGYKDNSAAAAGVGGIQQYFQAAAVAAGGSSRSTAAAAAAAVSSDSIEANAVQISRASTAARRDYNSIQSLQQSSMGYVNSLGLIPDGHFSQGQKNPVAAAAAKVPKMLTKRQERQLLEQGVIRDAPVAIQQQQQHDPLQWQQQQQSSQLVSKSRQSIETTAATAAASEGYMEGSRQLDRPSVKRPRLDGVWDTSQQQQQQPNQQVQQQQPIAAQQDHLQQVAVFEVEQQQQQQQIALAGAADNLSAAAAAAAEPSNHGVSHLEGNVDATAAANSTEFNIHSLGDWGFVSCEVVEEYDAYDNQCEVDDDQYDLLTDKECGVVSDTERQALVAPQISHGLAV